MDNQLLNISVNCAICGAERLVTVPFEGFEKWQNGALIQNAMPEVPANAREMLISGICPTCWDETFRD